MIRMYVRHAVNDFATWRQAYEAFHETQKSMGVVAEEAYQSVDDPNDVTAWHDFETLEAAQAFAGSDVLKEAMAGAGLAGPPTIWFVRRI